jgi:hypothetical protein
MAAGAGAAATLDPVTRRSNVVLAASVSGMGSAIIVFQVGLARTRPSFD